MLQSGTRQMDTIEVDVEPLAFLYISPQNID